MAEALCEFAIASHYSSVIVTFNAGDALKLFLTLDMLLLCISFVYTGAGCISYS